MNASTNGQRQVAIFPVPRNTPLFIFLLFTGYIIEPERSLRKNEDILSR